MTERFLSNIMILSCVAICKNEEHNVLSFLENLKTHEVKNLYVTDTGSTDSTVQLLTENWPKDQLFLSCVYIDPFDFSTARNTNLSKIKSSDMLVLHMDLDERIISLPNTLLQDTVYSCKRLENLWGTVTYNMPRITPATKWKYQYPIHESLGWTDCRIATEYESENFIISHNQKSEKDFYSSLTENWFSSDTRRLFFHRMCDLIREQQYENCVNVFQMHWEKCNDILTTQQKWQVIRNYQMSRIQIGLRPDLDFLSIFKEYPSASSYYYLSFFAYYLDNIDDYNKYRHLAETAIDAELNAKFNNKNIKRYVESLPI